MNVLITYTWLETPDTEEYHLYFQGMQIGTVLTDLTFQTEMDLEDGDYTFGIQAVNKWGLGPLSEVVRNWTAPAPPGQVTDFNVTFEPS